MGCDDGSLCSIGLDQHGLAVAVIDLTHLSDPELAGRALDETHSQPLLQGGYAAAEFGFGLADCPSSRSETSMFHSLREVIELIEIWHELAPLVVSLMQQ